MAVRLNALVDAWRQDRRPGATVELAGLLVKALARHNPRASALDLRPVTQFADEAMERNATDVDALLAVAKLLVRTGDLARADRVLERVARSAPEEPRMHKLAGEICLHRGDHAAAERHFSEARKRVTRPLVSGGGAPASAPQSGPAPASREAAAPSSVNRDSIPFQVVADAPLASTPAPAVAAPHLQALVQEEEELRTTVMSPVSGLDFADSVAPSMADVELLEDEEGETVVRGLGHYFRPSPPAASAAAPAQTAGASGGMDGGDEEVLTQVIASAWGPGGGLAPAAPGRRADPTDPPNAAWSPPAHPGPASAPPPLEGLPHAPSDRTPPGVGPESAREMPLSRAELAASRRSAVPPLNLPPPPPRRRGRWVVVVGVLCAVGLGIAAGQIAERTTRLGSQRHAAAAASLRYGRVLGARAHARLIEGSPKALAEADALLSGAGDLGGSADAMLARVRERAVSLLEADPRAAGLPPALERARAVGISEGDLAFAELSAAVAKRDAAAARAILARHDGDAARGNDAYWQLAAGAAMDLAADPKSIDRYRAALTAEPAMVVAEQRLVRALLLNGHVKEGRERVAALEGARAGAASTALVGLAWAVRREGPPPSAAARVHEDPELPRPLRSGALVVAAAAKTYAPDSRSALRAALDEADAPAMALLVSAVARDDQDVETVAAGAARALALDPASPNVAMGVARIAYEEGDPKEIAATAAKLPARERAAVSAIVAYEDNDLAELERLAKSVGGDPKDLPVVLSAALHRLGSKEARPADLIQRLRAADAVGGDAIAVDLLLDVGDLVAARELVASWPPAAHPLRAHRRARVMRYDYRMDEARAALATGAPTRLARIERALLAAELKDPMGPTQLDDDLGPVKPWLAAYQHAMRGDPSSARRALGELTSVQDGAPLCERLAAAAALGALGDRPHGVPVIRPLLNAWPKNPDVIRSAVFVGLLPRTALTRQ